jgi:myo-inositol-1(or 4)-monophosphatase
MRAAAIAERAALAERVAAEAGRRALDLWQRRGELVSEAKGDARDVVSRADREVEAAIREAVARDFPQDGFFGEELGAEPGRSGFVWVIDPIDGTTPFLAGHATWCVSIAVLAGERPVAAAVAAPALDAHFVARRGGGAWLGSRRLAVDQGLGIGGAMTAIGASHRTDPAAIAGVIERLIGRGGIYYRNGSGALMLAQVGAGQLGGYFEPHMYAWDALAGLLIVEEAGGRVGPYPEGALERGGRVIAAAPGVWDDLVAVAEGA